MSMVVRYTGSTPRSELEVTARGVRWWPGELKRVDGMVARQLVAANKGWELERDADTELDDPPVMPLIDTSWTLSRNTANFNALVRDMDPGQTMLLPRGEFLLDIDLTTLAKSIRVIGAGRPACNGSTMTGGTIIRGEVNIQGLAGAEVGFLGVDQSALTPASYPNGFTGGTATADDSSTFLNQYVHDIVLLGRGYNGGVGNSQHGVLFQNGRGFTCERVKAFKYLNNFVSRASGATFSDCDSFDAEGNAVLFKSASAGGSNDCYDNTAINVRGFATADGYSANMGSFSEDNTKKTRNSKFIGCTAIATGTTTGQACFYASGATAADSNRGTQHIGNTSRGDRFGSAFLVNDNLTEGVLFVGCNAEDFGGFSFRSNATGTTNLPSVIGGTCWRSGFADIVSVSGVWSVIEVNGQQWDAGNTRTVATLPSASFATRRFFVSDASAPTFGSTVSGGGAVLVPVYSDGTNWKVG